MPPRETRVSFTNLLQGDLYLTNAVAHNGSGLAVGDVDGDGRPDIYFCNLQGPNRLYRNLGNWRFQELALREAACAEQLSTGATLADVDGDTDLDLLVNGIAAGTRLFLNDGKGRWTEDTGGGLSRTNSPTSMALADIDGDGDLDLYCAHYIDVMHLADPTVRFALARRDGQWTVTKINGESTSLPRWKNRFEALPDGRVRELPEADALYRNDGHGRFTQIQSHGGVFVNDSGAPIPPYRDWGLAVMFRDLNGDGAPDLYVCNDNASPDRVWINSGQGTFRPIAPLALRHTSRSSMGVDVADLDRDGFDDIFVLDMLAREHGKRMTQLVRELPDLQSRERIDAQPRFNRNMLFFGKPDGSYVEAALWAGVPATDWSWCPAFLDVDLDGYEDLLVTNGFGFDVMDQDSHDQLRQRRLNYDQAKRARQFHPAWPTKNAAFRNRGDGRFESMDGQWGFDQFGISYGMALGDLDNDGDLDVVINNLNSAASLYRNDSPASRIAVRLKGSPPNTQGTGAKIKVLGGPVLQSQEVICGGRYLSGDDPMRVFAAGSATKLRIEVTWPNGTQSQVPTAMPNHVYEIPQTGAEARNVQRSTERKPEETKNNAPPILNQSQFSILNSQIGFADVSHLLNHVHIDESYDDWARQPLLPRRLSRFGPGVGWYDVNADGWEDLIVASGRGGRLAVYTNEHGQNFRLLDGVSPVPADQGAVLGWPDGRGNRFLLVAVSNYESSADQESEIAAYAVSNLSMPKRLPAGKASVGPMALADIDADGDLDLFVGGRVRLGRYPEPVSSSIWLNEGGELRHSPSLSAPFASVGLVSGSTFCDLDGDGDSDLALAVEWGPVRIFRNDDGRFTDATAHWGFAAATGWWTSITAGDFDGDGRLDLAAGNWGRNSIYELYRPIKLRALYGDWNGDGTVELVEAWEKGGHWLPVRDRAWLTRGLPALQTRFSSHHAFGQSTIPDILDAHYGKARTLDAAHLESTVFLNRGSHFEAVPLPREAQVAPVFSINVGDLDGDGIEDLFLSQNFFGSASDLARDDAGRGIWLRGSGRGNFSAIDSAESGIKLVGEQRGAALSDFNHDGRVDLAVSQNNAATKLYLNQRAARGLRVVMKGPAGNPEAVGAQLRVIYGGSRKGPCRVVQAGSGYWSHDGSVQVLGLVEPPTAVWICWPGGKEQILRVEGEVWELHADHIL